MNLETNFGGMEVSWETQAMILVDYEYLNEGIARGNKPSGWIWEILGTWKMAGTALGCL